jgi:hypothetical protein
MDGWMDGWMDRWMDHLCIYDDGNDSDIGTDDDDGDLWCRIQRFHTIYLILVSYLLS